MIALSGVMHFVFISKLLAFIVQKLYFCIRHISFRSDAASRLECLTAEKASAVFDVSVLHELVNPKLNDDGCSHSAQTTEGYD